jgi:diguanylate cyclase (GGDEF)-like protein/PAS domain S-box-containing protein
MIPAVLLILLVFLYQKTQVVSSQEVSNYTGKMKNLLELNSLIDREILAARMGLTKNYDAISFYNRQIDSVMEQLLLPPDLAYPQDYAATENAALDLKTMIVAKLGAIESFKRRNSIFHSSLSFFEKTTRDFYISYREVDAGLYPSKVALSRYIEDLMYFLSNPIDSNIDTIKHMGQQANALLNLETDETYVRLGESILKHGQVLSENSLLLNQSLHDIMLPPIATMQDTLSQRFFEGVYHSEQTVETYQNVLYMVAAILSFYLTFLFIYLERTRDHLGRSNKQLNDRYQLQMRAEKMLRLHEIAFNSASEGITLTDAQGKIMVVNPAFTRITGYEASEVIGRNPRVLKSGRHDAIFYQNMWRSINQNGHWRGEIWNRNKFGDVYPELLSITAVQNSQGELSNYVAVFSDISHIKKHEVELKQMAYYDPLTGLPNRALLRDRMDMAMAHCKRASKHMAVCYLDLDGFKPINDTYGHEAGDKLLVELGYRFKQVLRDEDTVARIGGDEFIFLLPSLNEPQEFRLAADRILEEVSKPFTIEGHETGVTASMGVALYPSQDVTADTLVRFADQAMYQIKKSGRNGFTVFDAKQDYIERSEHEQRERIADAIKNGELVLHYQPKVNMRAGTIHGLEALIRWQDPERGLIMPGDFLPSIEGREVMVELGDWVISEALRQMEKWRYQGFDFSVSVNVSAEQLQQSDFVEKLKAQLAEFPEISPDLMQLEILETTALEDIVSISHVIDECRALGVEVALDDFGTGYSSLTYLKRLPATVLKIDRSFVQDINAEPESLALVRGVGSLARAFGKTLLAEGVESVEHGVWLLKLGCDLAQGYGISKPIPADDIIPWVESWQVPEPWQALRELYWDDLDYPLIAAELEHNRWVDMVSYSIAQNQVLPEAALVDHHHCNFGRWYYSQSARRRYGSLLVFQSIEPVHTEIHQVVGDLKLHYEQGNASAVEGCMMRLLECQGQVLARLEDVQMQVASRKINN